MIIYIYDLPMKNDNIDPARERGLDDIAQFLRVWTG